MMDQQRRDESSDSDHRDGDPLDGAELDAIAKSGLQPNKRRKTGAKDSLIVAQQKHLSTPVATHLNDEHSMTFVQRRDSSANESNLLADTERDGPTGGKKVASTTNSAAGGIMTRSRRAAVGHTTSSGVVVSDQ